MAAMECFKQQPKELQDAEIFNYFELAYNVIKEQSTFIRETIFEEIRKIYFPQLPFRNTCIWVCEENSVEYWWNTLQVKGNLIFELNLTGTTYHAEQKHLIFDTVAHDTLRSYAFQYWTGIEDTNSLDNEILFEGVIDILKSYSGIEEYKESHTI